jgi:hypothetical protein
MRDQIEARAKDSRTSVSWRRRGPRVRATDRGADLFGESDSAAVGGLTVGEENEIEKAREHARLSQGYQDRMRQEEAAAEYRDAVQEMQREAQEHPELRAALPGRLAQAERDYTRDLQRFGAKGVYDPKTPKPDPMAGLQ